ncbi:fungal-specific transcription factor domain-containing protein [Pholiota molesta]|nr:fungal-specific transcription factor domain-containing protein [Pholiota molesta]
MDVDAKPDYSLSPPPAASSTPKTPVVRGARACTVCRAAKMKCVGAEDGQKQCQRCKRANVECVFEKHRRGRKPGSKLSDASKMLRRLEKGLNSAKIKSQSESTSPYYHNDDLRMPPSQEPYPTTATSRSSDQPYTNSHFSPPQLSSPVQPYQSPDPYPPSANGSRSAAPTEDDKDDFERTDEPLFPEKLIQENKRNSFFRTILNPDTQPSAAAQSSSSFTPPSNHLTPTPPAIIDPITAGILDEKDVHNLFDLVFLRLNPFINLFDPSLHTVAYVRSRCPFLFTTLLMAGCKFFKPEKFKDCQKLVQDFTVRAFAEGWKRVEVVQAFACLTYWKDPTDNRTWTYIGYACRMAVELGLNRYIAHPSPSETDFQRLERRNRERTYLVLFVHDRSLSMQTGRHWMLPEDDLIRHAMSWHEASGTTIRPEDVIIAAFVALRRIAAETTDIFNTARGGLNNANSDINYEHVLAHCNVRLTQWDQTWRQEMEKARGEKFHFSFLSFFRLHVRLFLNSFGIQSSMQPHSRQPPSLQALTMCCTSALESLHIVSEDFHGMRLLRYGQESITVMTAYSAIFLLKLLRTPNTGDQLGAERAHEIHQLIMQTANSYEEASRFALSTVSMAASYHARFLRSLVEHDIFKSRRGERERSDNTPIDPRLQAGSSPVAALQQATSATAAASAAAAAAAAAAQAQAYAQQVHTSSRMQEQPAQQFHFPASPHLPAHPHQAQAQVQAPAAAASTVAAVPEYQGDIQARSLGNAPAAPGHAQYPGGYIPPAPPTTELDQRYWKNMFIELGFGEGDASSLVVQQQQQQMSQYLDQQQQHQQQQHQRHAPFGGAMQSQVQQYQPMHAASTHPTYGH